jgi:hypothetical protein
MLNLNSRGYHAAYRDDEVNHCPGCGRTHWIIGRVSAECAFWSPAVALGISDQRPAGAPVLVHVKRAA